MPEISHYEAKPLGDSGLRASGTQLIGPALCLSPTHSSTSRFVLQPPPHHCIPSPSCSFPHLMSSHKSYPVYLLKGILYATLGDLGRVCIVPHDEVMDM